MKLNRRDALQLGRVTVVGGSALAVPVKPWGKEVQAATATISRLTAASTTESSPAAGLVALSRGVAVSRGVALSRGRLPLR